MSEDDSGLPQAVIDEMFKQANRRGTATLAGARPENTRRPKTGDDGSRRQSPPPNRAKTSHKSLVLPPSPALDDETVELIQRSLSDLTQRTAELETQLRLLEQTPTQVDGTGAAVQQLEEKLEAVARRLSDMDSRLTTVTEGLRGTPSYGVRNDFTCEACGSRDFLAIPLKCTTCGREGWWGWWPEKGK